jgi:hypothetical protein
MAEIFNIKRTELIINFTLLNFFIPLPSFNLKEKTLVSFIIN